MNTALLINLSYVFSSILFILGLKLMNKTPTARKGNQLSAVGMLIAIVATLFDQQIASFEWIIVGLIVGTILGIIAAKTVKMTSMPEMVALLNGLGGAASWLVGHATIVQNPQQSLFILVSTAFTVIVGAITLTGSLIAWAKLKEVMSGKAIIFFGHKYFNILMIVAMAAGSVYYCLYPVTTFPAGLEVSFLILLIAALIFGVTAVIPIGGADMPVVIAFLNSLSGIAACAAGFVVLNNLLIVAGALVGASGIILTNIMCKSMNRTFYNVLFGNFKLAGKQSATAAQGEVKSVSPDDAFFILEAARSVCIVPGYGLAVAQAQHTVKELGALLEKNGAEVRFAIHPVAGRMPGHMNVLLAEASVPYEQLFEMDAINPVMESIDVVLVIGANDVVNPAAREDKNSPIYGMPVINVDLAKTVIVLKRSMSSGFAGIDNPLFFKNNCRMLFGDAKSSVQALVAQFKS